jgi:putative SOS response-associated peptidase YedK
VEDLRVVPDVARGLWENWRAIRTSAIIAGEPNELLAPMHDRMPVIPPTEVVGPVPR